MNSPATNCPRVYGTTHSEHCNIFVGKRRTIPQAVRIYIQRSPSTPHFEGAFVKSSFHLLLRRYIATITWPVQKVSDLWPGKIHLHAWRSATLIPFEVFWQNLMQCRCSSRSVIFAESNNATRVAYTLSLTRWLHAIDAVCWRGKNHVCA